MLGAENIITALHRFKETLIKGKRAQIFYPKWLTLQPGGVEGGGFSDGDVQPSPPTLYNKLTDIVFPSHDQVKINLH